MVLEIIVTIVIIIALLLFIYGQWTWPHDAHITFDDIDQLRQFIDAGPPDESPDFRYPRVIFHLKCGSVEFVLVQKAFMKLRGVYDHGTELKHLKH